MQKNRVAALDEENEDLKTQLRNSAPSPAWASESNWNFKISEHLWAYYTNDELAQRPPYYLELSNADDELDLSELKDKRLVIKAKYDNIEKSDPNTFVCLLSEVKQAETEQCHLLSKWQQTWSNLEGPKFRVLVQSVLFNEWHRYLGPVCHPHRFEKHPYITPINCNHRVRPVMVALNGLNTLVSRNLCMDGGNSYHEKCTKI
uniref:Uncharacterized protein n=1 Tax=Glossina brevipalpis TaxID=37001 RepID=A0A1A9WFZ8_9MUSC